MTVLHKKVYLFTFQIFRPKQRRTMVLAFFGLLHGLLMLFYDSEAFLTELLLKKSIFLQKKPIYGKCKQITQGQCDLLAYLVGLKCMLKMDNSIKVLTQTVTTAAKPRASVVDCPQFPLYYHRPQLVQNFGKLYAAAWFATFSSLQNIVVHGLTVFSVPLIHVCGLVRHEFFESVQEVHVLTVCFLIWFYWCGQLNMKWLPENDIQYWELIIYVFVLSFLTILINKNRIKLNKFIPWNKNHFSF